MLGLPPRTRMEEIMVARGWMQKELAARGGWHTSNLSRILSGKTALSDINRRTLARLFQCSEGALLEPVGSPVPPPNAVEIAPAGATVPGFYIRLHAILRLLGIQRVEDLLLFLLAGDFTALPPKQAKRLRDVLRDVRKSGIVSPPESPPPEAPRPRKKRG